MDIDVFSLARQAPIKLSAARAIITDPVQTLPEFYERCREIFPLVLAPMTQAEIAGQRSLSAFTKDLEKAASERCDTFASMRDTVTDYLHDSFHLPARQLPHEIAHLPLYNSWRHWGRALYGHDDYLFGLTQTLRRDAAPMDRVIGDGIHGDCTLEHGYGYRALSLFTFCVDPALAVPADEQGAWWATQWCNMGAVPFFEAYNFSKSDAFSREDHQLSLSARCPSHALPANHHIVMPTWMLHHAGRFTDAPEDYEDRFPADLPQPKAYIAHTKLRIARL